MAYRYILLSDGLVYMPSETDILPLHSAYYTFGLP